MSSRCTRRVDADAPADVELGFGERRRALVFHHLDARPVADRGFAHGDLADAAHVEPHAREEFERVAPVVVSGFPKTTPIFIRSWLMNMSVVAVLCAVGVSLRRAWLMRRACRPMWESPMSPSISALGTRAATESTTMRIDATGASENFGDVQRLFSVVGLRDEQLRGIYADRLGVLHVERVLGVDERGDASSSLHVRDGVEGERRLAARFGPEYLDDAPSRVPADAERFVERGERP